MATQYGLTSLGFVVKQQQQIITEINASLQQTFGANINLGPESVFGQLVGIFSEREALLWQLADAVYASQYPSGALGTSVDNILALNNLKRLQPTATITNPAPLTQANGITLFGLVLKGTPGTIIPASSSINNGASPAVNFTLNSQVVISAAVNAVQQVFFSNVPTQGAYELSIVDPAGNSLTTASMALVTQNTFTYSPFAAVSQVLLSTPFSTSGTFKITLTQAGVALTTAAITVNATPATTASAIQTAIQALSGYSGVTVAVGSESSSGYSYAITWGSIANPVVTTGTNSTGVTLTSMDSVQAVINNLHDATASNYPYTDVVVSGSFASSAFTLTFGSGTAIGSNPVSSAQPQALLTLAANTLQNGSTVTNINLVNTTAGAPAQGIGQATCTATGPNYVKAGTLTTIGSPVSGWTSVTNQLDCLTGTNLETDTAALQRRTTLLAAQANGPLQSIVERVLQVSGVTAALGFQNLTGAAQQTIQFSAVPVSGTFTLTIGSQTTASINYNASAANVASALNALTGYTNVLVTGNVQYGFVVNFNGATGNQAQPLMLVGSNSTGVTITVAFGRPPNSFEIVVAGGTNANIAAAIYASMPAGIASYGSPVATTTGNVTSSSTSLTVTSAAGLAVGNAIFGAGVPNGTTITAIVGTTITMSLAAIGSYTGATYTFNNATTINDAFGNPVQISFSRPTQITFYVTVALTTDQYNTPGSSSSGVNPQSKFNPQTIPTIQNDIIAIGNAVPIGGLVIGFGTNGLIGAFNNVPGIISYTLYFGTSTSPGSNSNVQLQAEQQALFETFNTVVSYT